MSESPAAGLVILDIVANHPQLATWSPIHVARAYLLARMGRRGDSVAAYQAALALEPSASEREFIRRRIDALSAAGDCRE
jgi:RNA polymerase sigma-70 factor (ECF subfamily)